MDPSVQAGAQKQEVKPQLGLYRLTAICSMCSCGFLTDKLSTCVSIPDVYWITAYWSVCQHIVLVCDMSVDFYTDSHSIGHAVSAVFGVAHAFTCAFMPG